MKTDDRGFVLVDDTQRTSNERVYAAGDVTGAPQFVYVAAATGRAAAVNALAGDGPRLARADYTGLPSVVFTRPQLGSAGLTEADAPAAGHDCACRVLDLADVPRALVNRDTRGAVKVVADAATGRVLGVHALADGAGEMMLAATYAIKAGMTVDDIADTWAPYLTMAESLRITAGLFRNDVLVGPGRKGNLLPLTRQAGWRCCGRCRPTGCPAGGRTIEPMSWLSTGPCWVMSRIWYSAVLDPCRLLWLGLSRYG